MHGEEERKLSFIKPLDARAIAAPGMIQYQLAIELLLRMIHHRHVEEIR